MPIIKSAKKKLRQDKKRTIQNTVVKHTTITAVKKALKNPSKQNIDIAYSEIDTAVKKHLIHKNKAARLKSRVAKTRQSKPKAKTANQKS